MRRAQTDVVSRQINIECQLGYNPYGLDPMATSGQVSLFGPSPIQQNNISGGLGPREVVEIVGVVEAADAANDAVDIACNICVIS